MDRDFYKKHFEVEKSHWLMKVRRGIVRDVLDRYLGAVKVGGAKVLDFGCGSGVLVRELARVGFEAHGVEVSMDAVIFGESQGVENLSVASGHRIGFRDGEFDAFLALDVLEHIADEEWALREMERVLRPGGVAVIMVPAYMFLWGVQDEVAHHYRRYTMGRVVGLVKGFTDFEVVRTSYFNTLLFLPIAAVRVASRVFGVRNRESDFDLSNDVLDRVCLFVFSFERKLLRRFRFPFGVSILVVLRKAGGGR